MPSTWPPGSAWARQGFAPPGVSSCPDGSTVARTLVPSTTSYVHLETFDISDLHRWRRGISLDLVGLRHRSQELHDRWTRYRAEHVVGYVCRLAAMEAVRRFTGLASIP